MVTSSLKTSGEHYHPVEHLIDVVMRKGEDPLGGRASLVYVGAFNVNCRISPRCIEVRENGFALLCGHSMEHGEEQTLEEKLEACNARLQIDKLLIHLELSPKLLLQRADQPQRNGLVA
jgi:hypothetical protein